MPLPFAQARLLSTIEDHGEARISDLAALDHCSQPTMTTQVRRLEDAGLVSRTVDPDDARAVLIRITAEGRRHPDGKSASTAPPPSTRIWSASTPPTGRRSATPSVVLRRILEDAAAPTPAKNNRTGVAHHMWRQPKAVWAVAFASVVAFMGIGLVDPILKPIADNLNASPSQVSLLFTSYMAVMGVAMLITGVVSSRIGPKRTLLLGLVDHHRRRRPGGYVGHRGRNRRLAGTVGPGQRVVHRDRAGHHRQLCARLGGPGDHPLRGGAGPGHRGRPARRRRARIDLMARTVLRGVGADGLRAGRHGVPAAVHAARRARDHAGRPVPRAAPPRSARRRNHRAAVQLWLLHSAGVHAVPARHERPPDRADLLRLGIGAGLHVGGGRAAAAAPLRHRADADRQSAWR